MAQKWITKNGYRFPIDIPSEEEETIHTNYAAQKDKEYKQFRWARECGAISFNELNDLFSKIQSCKSLDSFKHSSSGEAIIEVNDKPHTTLGVNNVFVFVKGTKRNFYINRVVRFLYKSEDEMEMLRKELYDGRSWSNSYCEFLSQEGLAEDYRRDDSKSFKRHQQEIRRRGGRQESRGADANNRGRAKYRGGYHYHFGEDGEATLISPYKEIE